MRLSEKTIEINWCTQFTKASPGSVLWFGLTQKQEAMAGFDVCTKVGGRLLIFQFKASDSVLQSGARQFQLKHDQLTRLQARVNHYQRSVFYVFPSIGSTLEIVANPNVLAQSQLLDVARIPTLSPPTKSDGTLRRTGVHKPTWFQAWRRFTQTQLKWNWSRALSLATLDSQGRMVLTGYLRTSIPSGSFAEP